MCPCQTQKPGTSRLRYSNPSRFLWLCRSWVSFATGISTEAGECACADTGKCAWEGTIRSTELRADPFSLEVCLACWTGFSVGFEPFRCAFLQRLLQFPILPKEPCKCQPPSVCRTHWCQPWCYHTLEGTQGTATSYGITPFFWGSLISPSLYGKCLPT